MSDWLEREVGPKLVRRIAVAATVWMFVVLIMGVTVTNTGSAAGCGRSWPLCQGQIIPIFSNATLVEFSHRVVTGVETLLVGLLAVGAWVHWRRRREVRILVPAMVFFLFLQAGLGAWAVLSPQLPEVLALHFGVSLTAFATVLLTAVFVFEADGREAVRDIPIPSGLRRLIWGTIFYTYLLVYLGAYVRRTSASLACVDWPLCNGAVFPGFSGPVGIAFIHRLAAVAGMLLVAAVAVWTARWRRVRPDLYRGAVLALVLILAQSVSGAAIVFSRMSLGSTLAHAGLVTLLFGSLSYLCYHTLPRPVGALGVEPAGERATAGTLEPAPRA